MALDRQEKALREFKQIMRDLVYLIRTSTAVETAYLCWVNKSREQFVWESDSSDLPNVMFQDRIAFEQFFLNDYKEIKEPTRLVIDKDVPKTALKHHYDFTSVKTLFLIPFINNGETVAITVLESEKELEYPKIQHSVLAYNNALVNVLNTYLEVVDLHESQEEWSDYEAKLDEMNYRKHRVQLIVDMLDKIQECIPDGSVTFIAHACRTWMTTLFGSTTKDPMQPGLILQEKSLAYDALEKGKSQFAIHFNQTPRKVCAGEKHTEGATLAIPIIVQDQRQGVVVVNAKNPLQFKNSVKHKVCNLARITNLLLQASSKKEDPQDLFSHQVGCFIPEFWERVVDLQVQTFNSSRSLWFGLVTIKNLQHLRAKLRMDELMLLQQEVVAAINPAGLGFHGYLGFHSDYVYSFLIHTADKDVVLKWLKAAQSRLEPRFVIHGHKLELELQAGCTKVDTSYHDSFAVLTKAKQALGEAVRYENKQLVEA